MMMYPIDQFKIKKIMYVKKYAIISSLIFALSLSMTLSAQQSIAQLKLAKLTATQTFFNKSSSTTARLNALKKMGYPEDKTFNKLIGLSKNKEEDKQ